MFGGGKTDYVYYNIKKTDTEFKDEFKRLCREISDVMFILVKVKDNKSFLLRIPRNKQNVIEGMTSFIHEFQEHIELPIEDFDSYYRFESVNNYIYPYNVDTNALNDIMEYQGQGIIGIKITSAPIKNVQNSYKKLVKDNEKIKKKTGSDDPYLEKAEQKSHSHYFYYVDIFISTHANTNAKDFISSLPFTSPHDSNYIIVSNKKERSKKVKNMIANDLKTSLINKRIVMNDKELFEYISIPNDITDIKKSPTTDNTNDDISEDIIDDNIPDDTVQEGTVQDSTIPDTKPSNQIDINDTKLTETITKPPEPEPIEDPLDILKQTISDDPPKDEIPPKDDPEEIPQNVMESFKTIHDFLKRRGYV